MIIKKVQIGYCPICRKNTVFYSKEYWLRDHYRCIRCKSIPRQRAIIEVLNRVEPDYKLKAIHEASASGPTYHELKNTCPRYSVSNYFPNIPLGTKFCNGSSCENLEHLTLEDNSIDIFITQDVFEHVNNPEAAFKEISRVLTKGGKHIFTVPLYAFQRTRKRIKVEDGLINYLLPPQYHVNPINNRGSLVTYDWGYDIMESIKKWTGMKTKVFSFPHNQKNVTYGLEADFLQVLVSYH